MTKPFTTTLEKAISASDRQLIGTTVVEAHHFPLDNSDIAHLELGEEQMISLSLQQPVALDGKGMGEVSDLDGKPHTMLFEKFSPLTERDLRNADQTPAGQSPSLEIQSVLVVSTALLPMREREALDHFKNIRLGIAFSNPRVLEPIVDPVGPYGWRVCVDAQWPDQEAQPALYQGLALAKANGCQWIVYDCDADVIEQLTVYED